MKKTCIVLVMSFYPLCASDNDRASSSDSGSKVLLSNNISQSAKKAGDIFKPNRDQLELRRKALLNERVELLARYEKKKITKKQLIKMQRELLLKLADNLEYLQALLDLVQQRLDESLGIIEVKKEPKKTYADAATLPEQEQLFNRASSNGALLQRFIDYGIELLNEQN